MITIAWWWLLVWPALAFAGAFLAGKHQWRRWRRQERRHEVRLRLVEVGGPEWLNLTCHELDVIQRYGEQDEPPWRTLETIRTLRGTFRLQVAPAHPDQT